MFSFGLKNRTGEAIQRAAHALFLGTFIDKAMIADSDLNEEAKAGLYFYAVANCLFDVYCQMRMSIAGDKPWADTKFFLEHTIRGISAYEQSTPIPAGGLAKHCMPALSHVAGYAIDTGAWPDLMSAREVAKLDEDIDVDEARKLIVEGRDKFHAAIAHMFTPKA
jgi:hypothetical protein